MKFQVVLILLSFFIVTSCMRSDRKHMPSSEKFLGILPYEWIKPRAYRSTPFDGMPNEKSYYDYEIQQNKHLAYNNQNHGEYDSNKSYQEGYQAGCQTITSVIGSGLYRVRGPNIQPERMTSDPWFLRGYKDGTHVCTFNLDWETH